MDEPLQPHLHDPTTSIHNGECLSRVSWRAICGCRSQGSVVSAIGGVITAIVTAVADILIFIVNATVTVSVSRECTFWPSRSS